MDILSDMNIAIDTTFFGHTEIKNKNLVNSVSIFTADLLEGVRELGFANNFTLVVTESHFSFFKEKFPDFKILTLKFTPLSIINKLTKGKINGTKYIKKLGIYKNVVENQKFDLIWFPYTVSSTFVPTKIKSICTIHDLFRYKVLGEHKNFEFIKNPKNSIITISDYTSRDIKNTLSYEKEIKVIPNSIKIDFCETEEIKSLKPKKFLLNINAYIAKKNPLTLLKAFALIKDKIDFDLVFCGGYKDDTVLKTLEEFTKENKIESRVHFFYQISNMKKNWLLKNANLFITPSLFEGFGRTPVEAAICKIPVISTKETSLFEATMGLCNYVENPMDENELATLILTKIKNPDSIEKLTKISEVLQEHYKPTICAKKYLDIFAANC